jgi:hypothetical protein
MLTASLSAQTVTQFVYLANGSEQQFNEANRMSEFRGWTKTNKLPNHIIQAINNNLRNYSLNIGDIFSCVINYQGINYFVALRITDARNYGWQYNAWWSTAVRK